MNKNEQAAADALLEKLKDAAPNDAVQFATAYQALAQGVLCRKQAEVTGK